MSRARIFRQCSTRASRSGVIIISAFASIIRACSIKRSMVLSGGGLDTGQIQVLVANDIRVTTMILLEESRARGECRKELQDCGIPFLIRQLRSLDEDRLVHDCLHVAENDVVGGGLLHGVSLCVWGLLTTGTLYKA